MAASTPPPSLDPPFRGYIETTFDALLVFEAARRGMIPRVTRRLIERERGMVQSGAVFVFDEHESGIKRWTDGLVWSPSRILGNFLVYRETDKKPTASGPSSSSPQQNSPSCLPLQGGMPPPFDAPREPVDSVLGHGALPRPRSGSDGGGLDRQRERQLVGSLTNSYKFKGNGLVKKTMSVTVNGFAQHMISYYSVEDVLQGKLRAPSTVPELASLEISPEYLHKQNFRFPPMIEVGQDGIPRYRGEPEEPTSPTSGVAMNAFPSPEYDQFGQPLGLRVDTSRHRSTTVPVPIPMPHASSSYIPAGPSSASSAYFDHSQLASPPLLARQNSDSGMISMSGSLRPTSSSRRYDPYHPSPPRHYSIHSRRQSQPIAAISPPDYYAPNSTIDVKPNIMSPIIPHNPYNYQPPATAPSSFADFGHYESHPPQPVYAAQYSTWHTPSSSSGRFAHPRDYAPPSSSGSSGSAGQAVPSHPTTHTTSSGIAEPWNPPVAPPHPAGWDQNYVQEPSSDWRGHGTGTSVG